MEHYVGLDVGLEETSLCIVDSDGKTVREVKVSTEPAAIRSALEGYAQYGSLRKRVNALLAICAGPCPLQSGRGWDMARKIAALPAGSRITDYISLGVVAKSFPASKVHEILAATGKASVRERDLPAHVMVYYLIALALHMSCSCREVLRCLLEGVQWLLDPSVAIKVAGKSGITQARTRLGCEPLRRLHDEVVKPIATRTTRGARYRYWRLVSLDGSTLDIRRAGRERHPCVVRQPNGRLQHRRDHPGQKSATLPAIRHAVPGRPEFLWPRTMERGRSNRR